MATNEAEDRNENTKFQIPYAYCGLLDDVIARYDQSYNDPQLFNRILVKNLVFGGGLYLNDGYLFMQQESRRQLRNPDSVLSQMIETGYVHIFTRCNTLKELQDLIEKSDIPSHVEFRNSPEYRPFKARWDTICETAWEANHVTLWGPWRNHKVQSKLYKRVLIHEPENLGLTCEDTVLLRIYDLLYPGNRNNDELNPDAGAARTKYEEACRIALKEAGLSSDQQAAGLRQLMRLGNEAYHYAFAAILSWSQGSPVAAETMISPAFDEFIVRPEIDFRKFESIPTFGIPVSADLSAGKDLVPLMDPNEDAFKAKTEFISSFLEHLKLADLDTSDWLQRVEGTAQVYAAKFKELLPNVDIGDILNSKQLHQIALARGTTGSYDAAASPSPTVSASIVKEDGSHMGDCVVKYTVPDEDRDREWHFAGREIVPQVSSLAFHKSIVDELLNDDFLKNNDPYPPKDDDDD